MHFDCGHLSATGAKALFSPRRGLTRPLSIRRGTYSPSVSLAFDSSLYTREPEAYRSRQGVPRPRLPRQCAHCLAMTGDGQRAHCLAMTGGWAACALLAPRAACGGSACQKSLAEFGGVSRQIKSNHFLSGRVPDRKYISGCKSSAAALCRAQPP